jgi:hypothetical protein
VFSQFVDSFCAFLRCPIHIVVPRGPRARMDEDVGAT